MRRPSPTNMFRRPHLPAILTLAALMGGCQTTVPSDSEAVLGTLPTGVIDLTDEEVAEVASAFLGTMPWLRERPLHARASGTTGHLPAEVAGMSFEPWENRGHQPSLDLRFLSRDGDQLIVQAYLHSGIGGPDIIDLRLSRTEGPFKAPFQAAGGAWAVAEVLSQVGYL